MGPNHQLPPACPSARLLRIIYLIEEDLNTEQIYVHAKRLNQNEEHVYDLTQGYVKCSLGYVKCNLGYLKCSLGYIIQSKV